RRLSAGKHSGLAGRYVTGMAWVFIVGESLAAPPPPTPPRKGEGSAPCLAHEPVFNFIAAICRWAPGRQEIEIAIEGAFSSPPPCGEGSGVGVHGHDIAATNGVSRKCRPPDTERPGGGHPVRVVGGLGRLRSEFDGYGSRRGIFRDDVVYCFICFTARPIWFQAARLSTPAPLSSSASCLRA